MLGWLHGVPESQKGKDGQGLTRAQLEDWPMPDIDAGYLLDWWHELGLDCDYSKVESWARLTGTDINHQEVKILSSISRAYKNSLHKYNHKKYDLTPPYDGRTDEQKGNMISQKMKASIARFAGL